MSLIFSSYHEAVAREDLTGLVERLRRLPKAHKVALLILSYRKLAFWIDWQCEKLGIPVVPVEPEYTSTICPKCGLEDDRDKIAVLNVERRVLKLLGLSEGLLTAPIAPQIADVASNICGEPNHPEGILAL